MKNILQIGAPKCGNFWLYQIIQRILQISGYKTKSFIERQPIFELAKSWELNFPDQSKIDVLDITDLQYSYRISSIFKMPINNIAEYLQETPHIWTHSPFCKSSPEVFDLVSKKIYMIRDPRDRAISASKYYCSPYMLKYFPQEETDSETFLRKNFESLMHEWVWHVFDHLRYRERFNIHISSFERFLESFQSEFDFLLDYLEIDLNTDQRKNIENAVHFSTLKRNNPKHLKRGEAGYWKNQLTDEQKEKAEMIVGPLMDFLQYSSGCNQDLNVNGRFTKSDFEDLKREIIKSHALLKN